jgi:hypothetical protein
VRVFGHQLFPITCRRTVEIDAQILAYAVLVDYRVEAASVSQVGAADQLSQNAASRSGTVAIPEDIGRSVKPTASAPGGTPCPAASRGHGHSQTPGQVLSEGVTPAGEQLAAAAQKLLPRRSPRLFRRRDLCLNS